MAEQISLDRTSALAQRPSEVPHDGSYVISDSCCLTMASTVVRTLSSEAGALRLDLLKDYRVLKMGW